MSENQYLFYNLSKKERKALKRQLEEEAKKVNARNRTFKRIAIVAVVIAVVGFVGWLSVISVGKNSMQTSAVAGANVGKFAPDFSLPSTAGEKITLSDFKGKKNVLLYFHEGLSCDPCIEQMPELERSLGEFEKMNVVLLSVAFDPVDKLKEAAERYQMKTPILSYNNANTEVDYDLTRFSMGMGRRAGHTFILVDKDGKIIWRKDYWPGRGHMVAGGTMFVNAFEIVNEVKKTLNT